MTNLYEFHDISKDIFRLNIISKIYKDSSLSTSSVSIEHICPETTSKVSFRCCKSTKWDFPSQKSLAMKTSIDIQKIFYSVHKQVDAIALFQLTVYT